MTYENVLKPTTSKPTTSGGVVAQTETFSKEAIRALLATLVGLSVTIVFVILLFLIVKRLLAEEARTAALAFAMIADPQKLD